MTGDRLDTLIEFRFGDLFPPDDLVGEWLATITLAFNDIALAHGLLAESFEGDAYRYFYFLRLSLAHFNEAAKYLDRTKQIGEISAYVRSLPPDVQGYYDACLAKYEERSSYLAQVRNMTSHHYPEMKVAPGARRDRVMQGVLRGLADERTSFFKARTETIGDSRALFGDDIASRLFTRGTTSDDDLYEHHEEIRAAIMSFMRFANGAINEWFARAIDDRGMEMILRPGTPPSYGKTVENEP